jgi:hypothetical protein
MTALTSAPPAASRGFSFATGANVKLSLEVAAFMIALAVPTIFALYLDGRTISGVPVWVKPLKFEASIALHFLTLALLLGLVRPETRDSWWMRGAFMVAAAAGIFEIAYIAVQAARGRASHYNLETEVEATMYSLMGIGAVTLAAIALVLAIVIALRPASGIGAGLKAGALTGLGFGAVATLVTAGFLSTGAAFNPGEWVNGLRVDTARLPLVGWSMTSGDMRVPHFFATHLMQAVPLAGLLADRFAPSRALALTLGAGAIGVAIVVATFLQALANVPLIAAG